jgi:hypothetical protein
MKDWTEIRDRYLRDPLAVRLGGLAANLRRIKSFAAHEASCEALESMIDESKFFIEWTANEADVSTAAELVELQVQLARWQRSWTSIWADPARRREVADRSESWSRRVLEMSGLLSG